ncbi:MAG: hypothetical protein GC186_20025 [Rhodobacteraceae bacterium]|nr:hypothetical protein [Paracoccaceae bacterium]
MARFKLGHTPKEWHDRIMGRVSFDASAAEVAVRGVYRTSGLPDPAQILWADGPTEAARLVEFVKAPPRRQRHTATVLTAAGAMIFAALAVAIEAMASRQNVPEQYGVLGVMASVLLLATSQRAVPLASKARSGRPGLGSIAAGALIGTAMVIYVLGLQHLGSRASTGIERGGIVIVGAPLGGLPGVLFHQRLNTEYRDIRDRLRDVQASASVAPRLRRAQLATTWSTGVGWARGAIDESQLWVRDHAQMEAFAPHGGREVLVPDGLGRPPVATNWQHLNWPPGTAPGRVFQRTQIPQIPGFVDAFQHAIQFPVAADSNDEKTTCFVELAFWLDCLYPFRKTAVGVRPATFVATDVEGRVHADNGPAICWPDGTEIFAWHGYPVTPDILDPVLPITPSRIEGTSDPAARRALIDRYGLGRYLREAGACELERDECGRLYRLSQPFDEPIVAVRVRNATPEPDGDFQEFWLRVPPATRTAREGVAWTFGLDERDYRPSVES